MKKRHAWIVLLGVAVPVLGSSLSLAAASTTNGGWFGWQILCNLLALACSQLRLGRRRSVQCRRAVP